MGGTTAWSRLRPVGSLVRFEMLDWSRGECGDLRPIEPGFSSEPCRGAQGPAQAHPVFYGLNKNNNKKKKLVFSFFFTKCFFVL